MGLAILVSMLLAFTIGGLGISSHYKWDKFKAACLMAVAAGFVSLIASGFMLYGSYSDTEIWNGEVVGKERVHDSYVRSYSCMCTTVNKVTTCQTCYEDRYTVTWTAYTSIGSIRLEHLDSGWKSVYKKPDPPQFVECKIGDPVAMMHSYTNYIKGSADSLYNDYDRNKSFVVPEYPSVYNYYRINRVVGLQNERTKKLNTYLNNALRTLSPAKEVNVVVVVTDDPDPMYKYYLEGKWLGGKMNDVVVVLSEGDGVFQWTDAFTFAKDYGNEYLVTMLRKELRELPTNDYDAVGTIIIDKISSHYDRPSMTQFEYLRDEKVLSGWQMFAIVLMFGLICPIGAVYYLRNN